MLYVGRGNGSDWDQGDVDLDSSDAAHRRNYLGGRHYITTRPFRCRFNDPFTEGCSREP